MNFAAKLRPRSLTALVMTEEEQEKLRKLWAQQPGAVLFCGPAGHGKTTLARILALAKALDGDPFRLKQQDWEAFSSCSILEKNCADSRGIDDMREIVRDSQYAPVMGAARVVILDEIHMLTVEAQNMLLRATEDVSQKLLWIGCTTNPDKLIGTLHQRFLLFRVPGLNKETRKRLIERALKLLGVEADPAKFIRHADQLDITSPRALLNGLQAWMQGASISDAIKTSSPEQDFYLMARTLSNGDFSSVAATLGEMSTQELRSFRLMFLSYLKTWFLRKPGKSLGAAMALLSEVAPYDDTFAAWLIERLYRVSSMLNRE